MVGGRKLGFDKQQALEAAMHVFWEKGYLGAALADLTHAMGINKPSLYAAFGNKESLFLQATHHYIEMTAKQGEILHSPDTPLRDRLKMYLTAVVAEQCSDTTPKGCYISLCLSEAASNCMPAAAEEVITAAGSANYQSLVKLFCDDEEAQQLGLNKNAEAHALTLMTLLHGTASMARAGKTLEDLMPVIESALAAIDLREENR